MNSLDTERVARLLLQDVVPTLGERARAEVRRLAAVYADLAADWILNTTWPVCPRHPRHPLWYDVDKDAWCCVQDSDVVTPLGGLATLSPPSS